MTDQIYWNPVLETLPREKIRQLQLKKFKKIFKWTYERSKFHRQIYDQAGVKPEDIRSFEDIRRVPYVEKSMMRDIQRKDPFPYGDALCVPWKKSLSFARPAAPPVNPSTSRIPGRIGSGGPNAGHLSSGPRAIVPRIVYLFPSAITSLWLFGPATMPPKRSVAKLFREACWIPKPGSLKSRNCRPLP